VLLSASTLSGPKPSRVSLEHFTGRSHPPPGPIDPQNRSRQIGIGGHVKSECPVTIDRNTQNMQLRKIIKNRGHFPNDESAIKLLWLALRNVLNKAVRRSFDWKSSMNQFAILYGDRFTLARN